MRRIGPVLATIVWVCIGGFVEGCATNGGRLAAPSQREASDLAAPEQVARPGEDGTILLTVPTRLADMRLKSGRYEVQQRVDRGERLLHVMEVKRHAGYKTSARDTKRFVAEVRCRLEALGETAAETAVHIRSEAGVARVDWLTLAGEDRRYFPEAVRR
jgi:hypothetical protein